MTAPTIDAPTLEPIFIEPDIELFEQVDDDEASPCFWRACGGEAKWLGIWTPCACNKCESELCDKHKLIVEAEEETGAVWLCPPGSHVVKLLTIRALKP